MRRIADTLRSTFPMPEELELSQIQVHENDGFIHFDAYILVNKIPVGRFSSDELDDGIFKNESVDFINDELYRNAMNLVTPNMISALYSCPWANSNGSAGVRRLRAFTHALHALLEPYVFQLVLPMTDRFLIRQSSYTDFYFLSFNSESSIDEFLTNADPGTQQRARESFSDSYISIINSMERHERIVNDPGHLRTLRLACIETSNHRQWSGTF